MSNILVTGGAGFIGSFIVDELIRQGHFVRILDNLEPQVHAGKIPPYLNKKAEFVKGDVGNYSDFSKALKDIQIVFHEAALVGIEPSMRNIKKFVAANSLGTSTLLDLAINGNFKVEKIIVPSSVGIYGEGLYVCAKCGEKKSEFRSNEQLKNSSWDLMCPKCKLAMKPIPVPEDKPSSISNVYALTKFDQESMCMSIGKKYGIPVTVLRYFNVYGPRQSAINPYSGVITKFIGNILSSKPLKLYEDGNQSRDFINVHDIVSSNILAMKSNKANFEIFNAGTGKGTTVNKIAETLLEITGADSRIIVTNEYRDGDIRHCTADATKIRKMLGFEPKIDLKTGLMEVVDWYKNN